MRDSIILQQKSLNINTGTRLLRRLARLCFTDDSKDDDSKEDEEEGAEEEQPDRRWRNIGFQTSTPLKHLLHPSTRSPASIEPYRPICKRLPLLPLALMIRFGEVCPKMMRALASKLPPPPNYATFNFFETCQTLLNETSNLLALTPVCRTHSVATERARSHSEQRKRNLTRPDASGFIASDAFDMMLGAHVQTKKVEDDDEDVMLENRTQVQYFLDYCICGLKLILQDLSPERVAEAVSVRVRTTPKEAVERIREGMVSQPRIIEDLLRNVRKSIMILASHPPSPPSPKRMCINVFFLTHHHLFVFLTTTTKFKQDPWDYDEMKQPESWCNNSNRIFFFKMYIYFYYNY